MQRRLSIARKPYGTLNLTISRTFKAYQPSYSLFRFSKNYSGNKLAKLLWFSGFISSFCYMTNSRSSISCIEAPLQIIVEPHERRQKQRQFLEQSKEKVESLVDFLIESDAISIIPVQKLEENGQIPLKVSGTDCNIKLVGISNEVSIFITNSPKQNLVAISSSVLKIFEEGLELAYFKASNRQWKDWAEKKILELEKKSDQSNGERSYLAKFMSAFSFLTEISKANASLTKEVRLPEAIGNDLAQKKPSLQECVESLDRMMVEYLREHLQDFVLATKKIVQDKPDISGTKTKIKLL